MKKILILLLLSVSFMFVGCNKEEGEVIEQEYTIQYVDDFGQHKIIVKSGEAYSLDVLPEKNGYIFTGLFDSEEGGTQYVNENGSALSVFTDNKNLILFPQFKPKEYTLVLDYQGASVTGSRSIKVDYNSTIGELPMNLKLENKDFKGWFTKPNREGIQVADEYGVIPVTNQVTEENFDLTNDRGFIYLYAGFKPKEYTVSFYASISSPVEEIKVEHGTPISEVVPTTRIDGKAVLTWSKYKNGGEVFNGKVTDNMTLYAVEYAPVIEFESNGGKEVTPIVARAGDTIALPTPTKELAKFSHWEDMSGNKYTSTTMPSMSLSLKAVWQAKLVFDENGGSDVDDISEKAGTSISLPLPEKEGFIFAGWFTSEKEKYTNTTMPSVGMSLKAGWYKEKMQTKLFATDDDPIKLYYHDTSSTQIKMTEIDNSCDFKGKMYIRLEIFFKAKHYDSGYGWGGHYDLKYGIYTKNQRSDTTRLFETMFYHENISLYQQRYATTTFEVEDGQFFIIFNGCNYASSSGAPDIYIKDYYVIFYYPDTTNLYLW